MRTTAIALAAGTAAVLGASMPARASTGEWLDDDVHDHVGLVVLVDEDGEVLGQCTGTLIGDLTVLTAGHCTDGASSARVYFQQDAAAAFDADIGLDPTTGFPEACAPGTLGVWCVESDRLYDYGFDDFATFPDTHDVGLVVLDAPPSAVEGRAELPAPHLLDPLGRGPERNRTVFTVSGYGAREANPHLVTGVRTRLTASSLTTNLRSSLNDGFNFQTNGNGRGFAGSCSGDSGGPVFLGDADSDTIVAVASFALSAWCRGTDFSYRLDRPEVLAWIRGGYLSAEPEPAR